MSEVIGWLLAAFRWPSWSLNKLSGLHIRSWIGLSRSSSFFLMISFLLKVDNQKNKWFNQSIDCKIDNRFIIKRTSKNTINNDIGSLWDQPWYVREPAKDFLIVDEASKIEGLLSSINSGNMNSDNSILFLVDWVEDGTATVSAQSRQFMLNDCFFVLSQDLIARWLVFYIVEFDSLCVKDSESWSKFIFLGRIPSNLDILGKQLIILIWFVWLYDKSST